MSKRLGTYLLPAVLLLAALLPGRVCAQLDARSLMRAQQRGENTNLYGVPNPAPEDEEGQAQQPVDSTKEKRIKKPLESYFFSDSIRALPNFKWNVSQDYNRVRIEPLDTTLTAWRIDYPFYRNGVGDAPIGALGQGSVPLNYFERPQWQDFSFASPFHSYIYDMRNAPFYNGKRPFLQMTYIESGQKRYRETNFEIRHAQNISPTTGFNIDYKARGTRGLSTSGRGPRTRTSRWPSAHTGRRYSVHAGYVQQPHRDSRRTAAWWASGRSADTVVRDAVGRADAAGRTPRPRNLYRNHAFFVTQSYGIPLQRRHGERFLDGRTSRRCIIGHSFEYDVRGARSTPTANEPYTNERDHRDENGDFVSAKGHYYDNWFINPAETRDSIYERNISNRFFVQAQPWDRNGIVGTLDAGMGIDMHTYSQFELKDYLTGKYTKVNKTSYFFYGSVSGKIKKYVDWDGNLPFLPVGIQRRRSSRSARTSR